MQAFHNDQAVKDKYVERMKNHIAAGELIRGEGWDGQKGCAVGCTLNAYDPSLYPHELDLPVWLAKLECSLHENLGDMSPPFAMQFLEAIPVGADVEPVRHKLGVFIMDRNLERVRGLHLPIEIKKSVMLAIETVRDLHKSESKDSASWLAAELAAESALESAAEAKWSAEWLAKWPAKWSAKSAESAAESSAWSTKSEAAEAAISAAESAAAEAAEWEARAARKARASWAAASSILEAASEARAEEYDAIAIELLRLLRLA